MMIKAVVAVAVLLVIYVNADCVGLSPTPPSPQNLSFCVEYKDSACCKPSTDAALAYQWTNQIVPIYGSDGCGENIKALLCGFSCSPDQTSFATIGFTPSGFPALSVFVNTTVAEELFDSCHDRCLPFNPPATVGNYYGSAAKLLSGFNTSNDPSYNVSFTNPDISFHEGISSAGGALTVAQVGASGTDLTGCNGTDYQCIDPTNPYAAARALTFCTEYSGSACCSLDQENDLITNFNTKVTPLFGEDNCAENIKALFCAWVCSPKQREIVVLAPSGGYNTETVYVSQAFANGTYNSCKDRCFVVPGQPSLTIEQIYGSASYPAMAFITQFNSSNDASYKPDNYTHPAIVYQVGATNPLNGGDFDGSTVAGSGSDLTGCSTTGSTTSASDAVVLIASLVPLVAAFFVALF